MIRHIVLIKFRPDLEAAGIAELFAELHEIERKIPGLLSITSGRSESPEKMERGYMHGFVIDFDTWDTLKTYADSADHQALGGQLVENAVGGLDGILVLDLPV